MNPPFQAMVPASGGPPLRAIDYGPVDVSCEPHPDGGYLLRSRINLAPHETSMARVFRAAVERRPDHVFLAERESNGAWRELTYADARSQVDAVAQALLDRGLSAERP